MNQETIAQIARLRAQKVTVRDIATQLDLPSSTVGRIVAKLAAGYVVKHIKRGSVYWTLSAAVKPPRQLPQRHSVQFITSVVEKLNSGLSVRAVAELFGVPQGTVGTWLAESKRGRQPVMVVVNGRKTLRWLTPAEADIESRKTDVETLELLNKLKSQRNHGLEAIARQQANVTRIDTQITTLELQLNANALDARVAILESQLVRLADEKSRLDQQIDAIKSQLTTLKGAAE